MQAVLSGVIGPKKELHDLSGRVAIITGGANGIGLEVARGFCSVGCRVIMVNRKKEQGDEAIDMIKKETPNADIEWVGCDLGELKQVQEVFGGLREKEKRLDLLILNAGINVNQYDVDADGIDRHFGVNWLGNYYVLNQLWPLLIKTSKMPDTPAPRIVSESSEMHKVAPKINHFGSISEINNKDLSPLELYGRTKLAHILGMWYVAKKIVEPNHLNIYAISVHPGAVNTDMQNQWEAAYPGLTGKLMKNVTLAFGRSPEQGAYSAFYAATSPEIEDKEKDYNGKYFDDPGHLGSLTDAAKDEKLAASLWNLSQQLVRERLGPDSIEAWTEQ